jgi:hypothetical protein
MHSEYELRDYGRESTFSLGSIPISVDSLHQFDISGVRLCVHCVHHRGTYSVSTSFDETANRLPLFITAWVETSLSPSSRLSGNLNLKYKSSDFPAE